MRAQGTHYRIGFVPLLLALLIQFLAGAGAGAAMSISREHKKDGASRPTAKKPSNLSAAGKTKPAKTSPAKKKVTAKSTAASKPAAAKPPSPIAGKGMWIYELGKVAHGNPNAVAKAAADKGFTHIFVRVGSGLNGLNTLTAAKSLLIPAHRRGIKVIAWYFPYFNTTGGDVVRSMSVIKFRNYGHGFDGFAADIEPTPGSRLTRVNAQAYSIAIRRQAPNAYLVLVPPRVTSTTIKSFPYWALVPHYSAVAPMVYWGRFDPAGAVAESMRFLARFKRDIAPIGQAYNMAPEGGPLGNPSAAQTVAFMAMAKRLGAKGVSFWSWQHATAVQLHTIRTFRW
jgi:hypothetical protein